MQKSITYISYIEKWKYYNEEMLLRLTFSYFGLAWFDAKGEVPICDFKCKERNIYGYIKNENFYIDLVDFIRKNYDLIFKSYLSNNYADIEYYIIAHVNGELETSSFCFNNFFLPVELKILHKLFQSIMSNKEFFIFWKKDLKQLEPSSYEFLDHSVILEDVLEGIDEYNFEKIIEIENSFIGL